MIQYIRDSYKNIKLLVGLFVALILFLLLVKYTFPKYQQKQNLKVLEYEGFILEKKKIPNVDPFYDTLVSQLEWRNYQFNSEINSEEIENLLKDASNISKVLKDMKFEAYVDLLSYFSFKRKKKAEVEIIKRINPQSYEASAAMAHVVNLYITPIGGCLSNQLYERPSILSEQAFLIYRNIDTDPNSDIDYSINDILLSKALFEYPDNVVKDHNAIKQLYEIMIKGFNPKHKYKLANINPITEETRMLKKYWEAIYHFRNDKFVDCSSLMSEIKHTSKNFVLKHLAAFMEARCLFWDTRTNWELLTKEDKNRVVKTLEEYSKQVSFITSLKTDIDFYIHEILSWSENYNIEN